MPSFVSKFLITGDGELLIAPASDGSAGQILQTDGNGQLSFTIPSSNGMSDLIDDTTPQLGGNLDLNGFNIGGVTPTEFTYLSGVTSDIQTQLDGKAATSHTHTASDITDFDTEVSNNPTVASALQDVVDDTTPQLGGNLDVNGNSIVSVSNGNISLIPDGTGNVVLGTLTFDGDMAVTSNEDDYVLTYDDTTGTVSLEVLPTTSKIDVKNDTAGTLLKGRAVHVTGSHTSGKPTIEYADSSSASTMNAIGILEDDIVAGGEGNVILAGIIENIDTSSYTSGDTLYVGTSGVLTDTKPTGTDLIQNMGMVGRSHASSGSFIVIGSGRSNDVPNLPQDFLWLGNASGVATPTNKNEITELSDDTTPQLGGNLDLNGFALSSPAAIDNDAAGPEVSLLFQNGGTSTAEIQYDDGARDMYFAVGDTVANGAMKMTIDSTGNVGIGTTSPGGKLHIDGVADESIGFLMRTDYTGGVTDGDVFRIQDGSNRDGVIFGIDADAGYFRTQYVTGSAYIESSCASSRAALRMNRGTTGNDIGLDFRQGGTVKWTLGSWSSDATNNLSLTNGGLSGTKVVTIEDSTGNIGIGTSSPGRILDVYENSTTTNGMVRIDQDGTGDASIIYRLTGTQAWMAGIDNSDSDKFKISLTDFDTNSNLVLDTTGNIGIGTASPAHAIHVVNSAWSFVGTSTETDATDKAMRLGSKHYTNAEEPCTAIYAYNNSSNNHVLFGGGTGMGNAATLLSFYTAANNTTTLGTERMRIDSSGNVGIGTASPSSNLHVEGTTASANVGVLRVVNNTTTAGQDAMRIMMPSAASGALNFSNNGGQFWRWFLGSAGEMRFDSADGVSKMYLTETGNLGLGAAPGAKLHTSGGDMLLDNTYSIQWKDSGGTARDIVTVDSGDNTTLRHPAGSSGDVYLGSASLFTLKSSTGNVGIGTTSPSVPLHLSGSNGANIRQSDTGATTDTEVSCIFEYYRGDNTSRVGYFGFGSSSDADFEIVNSISTGNIELNPGSSGVVKVLNSELQVTGSGDSYFSSGNVGIGTTSPQGNLHVSAAGGAATPTSLVIWNTNTQANQVAQIEFGGFSSATDNLIKSTLQSGGSRSDLSFWSSPSTEAMTIKGDTSYVGIGTASPSAPLQVAGNATFDTEVQITNLGLNIAADTSYNLYSSNNTAGLGGALFEGDSNAIIIDDTNDYTGLGTGDFTCYNGSNFTQFGTAAGHTAVFAGGNVGIGDTAPGHLLEIADGFRTAPVSSPSGTAESGRIYMDSDDDRLKVYANGADRPVNTMTPVLIRPQQLVADATNPFAIVTRNQHVLAAFDASTDETGYYTGVLPADYQGDGLTVEINWVADSTGAGSEGNVIWNVAFESLESQDIDSDGFAAVNASSADAANATNGIKTTSSITFTDGADMDSVAAGDMFRMKITRDADNASDTMTEDAEIIAIYIKGTNDA